MERIWGEIGGGMMMKGLTTDGYLPDLAAFGPLFCSLTVAWTSRKRPPGGTDHLGRTLNDDAGWKKLHEKSLSSKAEGKSQVITLNWAGMGKIWPGAICGGFNPAPPNLQKL